MSNVTALRAPKTAPAEQWLSPESVCEVIPGMTVTLLSRMRDAGRGPAFSKPSAKTVVYARSDVEAFLRSTRVSTREQS